MQQLRDLENSPIIKTFVRAATTLETARQDRIRSVTRQDRNIDRRSQDTAERVGQNQAVADLLEQQMGRLEESTVPLPYGDTPSPAQTNAPESTDQWDTGYLYE